MGAGSGSARSCRNRSCFQRSLRDNIRLGSGAAPDREIEEAARAACIDETIRTFEQGYETLIGERGITLSGGQRQRVAIARAILRNPPLLILDDALSAVDGETETLILDALQAAAAAAPPRSSSRTASRPSSTPTG
jgi:ATP-binding cassette subfamily B protein